MATTVLTYRKHSPGSSCAIQPRLRSLLDRFRPDGKGARLAQVLVEFPVGKNEQEPAPHRHGLPASRAIQCCCIEVFILSRRLPVFHRLILPIRHHSEISGRTPYLRRTSANPTGPIQRAASPTAAPGFLPRPLLQGHLLILRFDFSSSMAMNSRRSSRWRSVTSAGTVTSTSTKRSPRP